MALEKEDLRGVMSSRPSLGVGGGGGGGSDDGEGEEDVLPLIVWPKNGKIGYGEVPGSLWGEACSKCRPVERSDVTDGLGFVTRRSALLWRPNTAVGRANLGAEFEYCCLVCCPSELKGKSQAKQIPR
ncbi:hypothetical protein TMatcc_002741 [Talaromyces marneffei ATCC 18224]